MAKHKENRFLKELKSLLNSFKINKIFNYSFLVELFFYLVVFVFFNLWVKFGLSQINILDQINILNYQINSGNFSKTPLLVPLIQRFLIYLVGFTLLFVFALLFGWITSRILVWTKLMGKKITKKLYFKFSLLKIVWMLIWLPLIILFFIPFFSLMSIINKNPGYSGYLIMFFLLNFLLYLVISYFGMFLYKSFFNDNRIYKSMTDSFRLGVLSFPKLLLPLLFSFIIFLFYYVLMLNINNLFRYGLWINLFIFVYVFTALRLYILSKVISAKLKK